MGGGDCAGGNGGALATPGASDGAAPMAGHRFPMATAFAKASTKVRATVQLPRPFPGMAAPAPLRQKAPPSHAVSTAEWKSTVASAAVSNTTAVVHPLSRVTAEPAAASSPAAAIAAATQRRRSRLCRSLRPPGAPGSPATPAASRRAAAMRAGWMGSHPTWDPEGPVFGVQGRQVGEEFRLARWRQAGESAYAVVDAAAAAVVTTGAAVTATAAAATATADGG